MLFYETLYTLRQSMALTKKDIQIIKQLLKEVRIDVNALKIYCDTRFNAADDRMGKLDRDIKKLVYDTNKILINHENQIGFLEEKQFRP